MPEYTSIADQGRALMVGDDLQRSRRWLHRQDGKWVRITMELVEGQEDPKTAEQLGYYHALLLPEIHKQMRADGHTQTIKFRTFEREIPITRTTAHEIITEVCGRIGKDGALLRLSECDKDTCRPWIDNVLNFAGELRMKTDKLKALRKL